MGHLLLLFAPDSITVTVETKYVRSDYAEGASSVQWAVTGAARAIIIASVRVKTYPLIGWVANLGWCYRRRGSGRGRGCGRRWRGLQFAAALTGYRQQEYNRK